MLTSLSALTTLAAQPQDTSLENGGERTNITFEKGSIEDLFDSGASARSGQTVLVYTYIQNGVSYKVYDMANTDLSYSHSLIYEVNSNSEEILVREETVQVKDDVVTTTINESGQETVEVLNLNSGRDSEPLQTLNTRGTWNGWPVSNTYQYYGTWKYSYSITGTTVAAVTITINAIVKVAENINPVSKVTVTAISALVNYIVNKNVKRTYVIDEVSYRWTQIPNAAVQQRAVERANRTFYTDSNYATVIGTVTTTAYAKEYKD